jgi:hypothetical protein
MTSSTRTRPAGVGQPEPRDSGQATPSRQLIVSETPRRIPRQRPVSQADVVPDAAGRVPAPRFAAVNPPEVDAVVAIGVARAPATMDVVHAAGLASRLIGQPWIGTLVRERHDQRPGGLPLPRLTEPVRETSAYYTVTTVDGRGRLADGSPLRALQWGPGLPLKLMVTLGAVVAAAHPDGRKTVTSQGHLRLPADLRHALRLNPGDRLLVVAHPHQGLLVVYTMPALDAMVLGYHSSLAAEVSA